MKTREQIRAEFVEAGVSISEWARVNGFSREVVVGVLSGRIKGSRGESHRIAVALGIKSGRVVDAKNLFSTARKAA